MQQAVVPPASSSAHNTMMQSGPIATSHEPQVMSHSAHRANLPISNTQEMAIPASGNQGDITMSSADAEAGSQIDQSLWAMMPATHHQQLMELQNAVGPSQTRTRSSQSLLTCVDMTTGAMSQMDTAVVSDTALSIPVPT